jgi:hypothetical protein
VKTDWLKPALTGGFLFASANSLHFLVDLSIYARGHKIQNRPNSSTAALGEVLGQGFGIFSHWEEIQKPPEQ